MAFGALLGYCFLGPGRKRPWPGQCSQFRRTRRGGQFDLLLDVAEGENLQVLTLPASADIEVSVPRRGHEDACRTLILPRGKSGQIRVCPEITFQAARVMNEKRGGACQHIVRVEVGDGEVACFGGSKFVVADGLDGDGGAVGGEEGVAGLEVGGLGPAGGGDVPVGVVLGGGEGVGGGVVGGSEGEVGEEGVVGGDDGVDDGFAGGDVGLGVGGQDLVADGDVTDGFGAAVGEEDGCRRWEAVRPTDWAGGGDGVFRFLGGL